MTHGLAGEMQACGGRAGGGGWARRLIAVLVSGSLAWWQIDPSYAQNSTITTNAAAGQTEGTSLIPTAGTLFQQNSDGSYTLNPTASTSTNLSASSVFGGASSSTALPTASNVGDLNTVGTAAENSLNSGSGTSPSAYETVLGGYANTSPDLSSDSIFSSSGTSNQVLSNLSSLASQFGDCTTTTTYQNTPTTGYIQNLQTCSEPQGTAISYNLTHQFTVAPVTVEGETKFTAAYDCGTDCVDFTKTYYGGNSGSFTLAPGTTINSVTVVEAAFNCGYPTSVDGTEVPQNGYKCYNVKHGVTPNMVALSPAITITPDIVSPITTNNDNVSVANSSNPNDYGGMGIEIRVVYSPAPLISGDVWESASDAASVISYLNEPSACSVKATCNTPAGTTITACLTINGESVCPNDFTTSTSVALSAIVNPACTSVSVTGSCSAANIAIPCYTDAEGNQECPTSATGSNTDSCQTLINNGCTYVTQACADGATNSQGICTDEVDTYQCGQSVTGSVPSATQTISCAGTIQCMGTSCVNQSATSNSSFAQVAADLQAVQSVGLDGSCSSNDTSSCTAFGGSNLACKKALGGYVNCCTHEASVSLSDYLHLMFETDDLLNDVTKVDPTGQLAGAWTALNQPLSSFGSTVSSGLSQAWSSVQQGFTGVVDSLGGTTTTVATNTLASTAASTASSSGLSVGSIPLTISGLEQIGMQDAATWLSNTFGEAAADSLFSTTAGGAAINGATGQVAGTLQLGGGEAVVGTVLVWIGAAYAVYSIATTIIQLIYACQSSELQLDTDRQLDECHYVGTYCSQSLAGVCFETEDSYCCFASPLSRIIQEQARAQLGIGWGEASSPNCGGLTLTQISDINWSTINLSEWISIEESAGVIPSATSLNSVSLTGSGSPLQAVDTSTRVDAITRSEARTSGIDVQGINAVSASEIESSVTAPGLGQ